ncbi:MAG: hypothetical protein ABIA75_02455 [Candidatus Neomarinimicrobiota bacterium]
MTRASFGFKLPAVLIILMLVTTVLPSQPGPGYHYQVDLTRVENDRIQVVLEAGDFAAENLVFRFTRVIPGTYRILDYSHFVSDFSAVDHQGQPIAVKRRKNSFYLSNAKELARISYRVDDTWDKKRNRGKIHPAAGTNFDEGRHFMFGPAGIFGYFAGQEKVPVDLTVTLPEGFIGVSGLTAEKIASDKLRYRTADFHELVDSPIMFARPDTIAFNVGNTSAMIGVGHALDSCGYAEKLYANMSVAMDAIATFLDTLPADNYTFIVYFDDARELGKIESTPRFRLIKMAGYLIRNGFPPIGALEHNKSSFFYIIDPGDAFLDQIMELMSYGTIHEFMHIITPLNLHSQLIADYDYENPVMSKHLWLYEGVTDYFADLLQVRSGMKSPMEYLSQDVRTKLRKGEKFPYEEMSFTEMSANILEKKYQKQFGQVYKRGTILGMLLDLEIIRLTGGEKTLIDVIMDLSTDYGPDRPFDEATFIAEFVDRVHPDLQLFFDRYVAGREKIPYQQFFSTVGVVYEESISEPHPRHLINENDVKASSFGFNQILIKKVGKDDFVGFRKGDLLNDNLYHRLCKDDYGNYLPEGTEISVPVQRDGEPIELTAALKYVDGTTSYKLSIDPNMSPEQSRNYRVWLGIPD